MRNKEILKGIEYLILVVVILSASASTIHGLPTPHGVSGYILELDDVTQVRAGTHFSVEDTTTGSYIEGVSGRGINPGKYSVAINGNDGDAVILRAWTAYNSANLTFTLSGVMRNVNMMLNTSLPPLPPFFITSPVTSATESYLYTYQVQATDPNDDILFYSLVNNPIAMDINTESGLISWIPSAADAGNQTVIVSVSDGIYAVNQSFTISVAALPPEEIPQPGPITPSISTNSGGGGGGSGGGLKKMNMSQKEQKVIIVLNTEESPISQVILRLRNITQGIGINITKLPYRPDGTKTLTKKVYQYLKIDKQNLNDENIKEAEIEFIVEKSWIEKNKAKDNDVVLNHYTKSGWNELDTVNVSKDAMFVYYQANTSGFSFFAISLKYAVQLIENITSNTILNPFSLYGIVYKTETQQMPAGTPFIIENTNTGETVDGITGIGPNPGAYSVVMHGHEGDLVSIKIGSDNYNASFSTILRQDTNTINFLLNEEMGGFVPMTKENVYLSRISHVRTIVFINSALIIVILLVSLILFIQKIRRKNNE